MTNAYISFPILNNIKPTIESCTMKVLEEVGELMQLLGKGQSKSGEQKSWPENEELWVLNTIEESLDVAQSAITLAYTLCQKYMIDMDIITEHHEEKLRDKEYLI